MNTNEQTRKIIQDLYIETKALLEQAEERLNKTKELEDLFREDDQNDNK